MKHLRRAVWFVAGRLLVLCLVLGILITVFYYAMNLANIQIILKDGMANRAKYIMGMTESPDELNRYFHSAYASTDAVLTSAINGNSAYKDYNIRGIDHRLDMGFLWVWPWDTTVRVNITERIPRIDGRVKGLRADEVIAKNGQNAVYPPEWQEQEYRAVLVKESGQWKIRNLMPIH